jgi:hypothetical protein
MWYKKWKKVGMFWSLCFLGEVKIREREMKGVIKWGHNHSNPCNSLPCIQLGKEYIYSLWSLAILLLEHSQRLMYFYMQNR